MTDQDRSAPSATRDAAHPPLAIHTHDELVANLPEILRRINADPALGRLVVVNPLFVLEDIGVTLSSELKDHLRRTLGFPQARVDAIVATRKQLREQLDALGERERPLPKTPREVAELVFGPVGVPYEGERPTRLLLEELRPLQRHHPIVATLYRLGKLERGALMFWNRSAYEEYRAGKPHHPWLKGLRFRI